MDNYIGRLLDNRYEILESIGAGGMAVVYKARCHRLNRMVAIKVLKDELSVDAEFRRRFHAESQAVAMLSHPNIVNVYDVSHSDNVDYIVMELIEGLTLKQYMQQKGVLNWREALHLSTQIAKALEHAHGRGIIHRDIKPHNIMILKDGTVKVADFGIARVSSAQNTLTREALGSVHYISPEQAKGGKIDYRSDIYSLGVVLYEMLTGKTPYDGETPVSVAIQHINAKAEPPRSLNPNIPVGMEYITMHAMAADLDLRYESASAMLGDLDEFRRNPKVNFHNTEQRVDGATIISPGAGARNAPRNVKAGSQKQTVQKKYYKSNSVTLVAGIICIMVALLLVAGIFFFVMKKDEQSTDVEVPQFVGLIADDIDRSKYPDLNIVVSAYVPSNATEAGVVIKQDPQHKEMVQSGENIYLTVSSGPATNKMPRLEGMTEQNACTELDNLGLGLEKEIKSETSQVYEQGIVIRTDPQENADLEKGQRVRLYISAGSDFDPDTEVRMEALKGKDVSEAIKILEASDLEYSIEYKDAAEAEGTVIYQSEEQNVIIKKGSTVNLHVSNGAFGAAQPDVSPTDVEGQNGTNTIWVPKPEINGTVTIRILIDGAEVYNFTAGDTSPIPPRGIAVSSDLSGVHSIDVYLDGKLYHSAKYDFNTGMQVTE